MKPCSMPASPNRTKHRFSASVKLADDLGIDGTPAVYVNGESVNGGAVPQNELWMAIDRAVRAAGEQPPPAQAAATPTPAGAN